MLSIQEITLRHKLFSLALLFSFIYVTPAFGLPPVENFIATAPDADPEVLRLAYKALSCAENKEQTESEYFSVIDYSYPSKQPRFWLFDLKNGDLLFEELVAHGKNTGLHDASEFSNIPGSKQSSLGLFRTGKTYSGRNGYSLRMHGLEPGYNDKALERAIVMHAGKYVNEDFIARNGRIGRSWGCPALRPKVTKEVINLIKNDEYIFIYYPDSEWIENSDFINCKE